MLACLGGLIIILIYICRGPLKIPSKDNRVYKGFSKNFNGDSGRPTPTNIYITGI